MTELSSSELTPTGDSIDLISDAISEALEEYEAASLAKFVLRTLYEELWEDQGRSFGAVDQILSEAAGSLRELRVQLGAGNPTNPWLH